MSHIPFGMQSFMRHAPSQCLTAYVTSHIPCGMRSFMRNASSQCERRMSCPIIRVEYETICVMHAPYQCLTLYIMSHTPYGERSFMLSCTISMSNTVCHVSYPIWIAKLLRHTLSQMSNAVCDVAYSMWRAKLYA